MGISSWGCHLLRRRSLEKAPFETGQHGKWPAYQLRPAVRAVLSPRHVPSFSSLTATSTLQKRNWGIMRRTSSLPKITAKEQQTPEFVLGNDDLEMNVRHGSGEVNSTHI